MAIISLEGVSKGYRILPSWQDRLKKVLSFGKAKVGYDFWALEDINLEVEAGTSLGIIGRNGAGKTTLLRMISGILQPTSGTVRVNGRLVALFALGAGFNDDFTGRENVMLNGLVLGIERKEMLERFDEIEAFADIGEFMYQPIKTYSSGMRARLGFAVAVTVEPDILVVDEALATGDAIFKAKGIQRMVELRDSGTTILFVSHSTSQVQNFCTEAALLHKGRLISRGDTTEVIDEYQALLSKAAQRNEQIAPDQPAGYETAREYELEIPNSRESLAPNNRNLRDNAGDVMIQNVELLDDLGKPVEVVAPESELTVRVHAQYVKDVEDSVVSILLRNKAGLDIFSTNTALENTPVGRRRAGERMTVDFTFRVPLKYSRYSVAATVSRPGSKDSYLDRLGAAAVFRVSRPSDRSSVPGLIHLPTQVEIFEPDRAQERTPPA